MTVVVIGARGYIGRALCAALARDGDQVHALSSSMPGGIEPHGGSFAPDLALPKHADAVVFLAQSPQVNAGLAGAAHALTVNCVAAVQAAHAAVAAGIPRFLYTSTGNVYAPSFAPLAETDPVRLDNLYSLTKVHAEQALALFSPDLSLHVLRLFGVYGPGQRERLVARLVEHVLRRQTITLAPPPGADGQVGGLRLSLTYIDDVVECVRRVIRGGGPPLLNVAGPVARSVREIATAIGGVAGIEPVFEVLSASRAWDLIADTTLLEATLGLPTTPFEQGIAATVRQASSP